MNKSSSDTQTYTVRFTLWGRIKLLFGYPVVFELTTKIDTHVCGGSPMEITNFIRNKVKFIGP